MLSMSSLYDAARMEYPKFVRDSKKARKPATTRSIQHQSPQIPIRADHEHALVDPKHPPTLTLLQQSSNRLRHSPIPPACGHIYLPPVYQPHTQPQTKHNPNHAPQRHLNRHPTHPPTIRLPPANPAPGQSRSKPLPRPHVRHVEYVLFHPPNTHFSNTHTDCWGSNSQSAGGCAHLEAALRECMDAPRAAKTSKSSINYHLGRLFPQIRGPRKRGGSIG